MGVHYKHITKSQPIFRNDIVPGRTAVGIDGRKGGEGMNGASIHFSDYTPSNDYIKEIMLEKIKNNITLSSQNETKIERITYRDGDIIITNDLFAYRLTIKNEEYSFRFLGKIINRYKEYAETPEETLLNNIAMIEFRITDENVFNIPVPSNRSMDASVDSSFNGYDYQNNFQKVDYDDASTSYANSYKKTIGFTMKPIIRVANQELVDNWDFYLKIYLENKKSPQSSSYVLNEQDYNNLLDPAPYSMQGAFEFYKYAEIKLNATCSDSSYQDSSIAPKSMYNITDMSCDKLHPSGNNINSNYITAEIIKGVENNKVIILGGIDMIPLDDSANKAGSIRKPMTNYDYTTNKKKDFIENSQKSFHVTEYKNTRGMVQLSMYNSKTPNFRSGDSAYFSGMCTPYNRDCFNGDVNPTRAAKAREETSVNDQSSYNNFVRNVKLLNDNFNLYNYNQSHVQAGTRETVTKEYVVPELKNFFLGSQNIYELTCVNRKTGLTKKMYTENIKIIYEL